MSIDSSLKSNAALASHRNVLKRDERIQRLIEDEKFDPESDEPLGLVKVANRRVRAGKKSIKKDEEGVEGAEGVEGEAPPAAG